MNGADYKLVLIVAYPRSGTTWVSTMFAHHPDAVVLLHGALFHALEPLRTWWTTSAERGRKVMLPEEGATGRFSRTDLNQLLGERAFAEQARPLARYIFDTVAAHAGKPQVVVEKTPENVMFLPWILDVLPDVYILHIVRDPRSTYASIRSALGSWAWEKAFPPTLRENTELWCEYIDTIDQIEQRTDRVKTVRYESLLEDGATQLHEIYEWLGLASDAALCEQVIQATGIEKLRKQNIMPASFFRTGVSEGWRDDLRKAQIASIEYLAEQQMERMGYRPTEARTSKPLALRLDDLVGKVGRVFRYRVLRNRLFLFVAKRLALLRL